MAAQLSADQRLQAESNPRKRAELALICASNAFDDATRFYEKGDVHQGDAELDDMTKDLNECLGSLREAHKGGNSYQKAELKVASLQRRLHDLIANIAIANRGWAEQTERAVDGIHDQLLLGAMKR
jgi:hypothetical protein